MEIVQDNKNWKSAFFPFWLSQMLSILGSMLVQFTLIWWLTERTGSAAVLATATLFGMLPELLIQPFAGAIVDRINRKTVIIVADSVIAAATVGLAAMFMFDRVDIPLIYAIMALRGVGSAFHFPAEQASVAMMVPKEQLARIAGFNQAAHGILSIISAPIGALVLEFLNIEGALLIDVFTAVIAILIVAFISIPRQKALAENGKNWFTTTLMDMRDGFKYLLNWKALAVLTTIIFIFKIALVPAISLIPLFVYQELSGSAAQYSLTEVATGIGLIAGGLILSAWGGFKKHIHTIILGGVGVGVGFLAIGFLPQGGFYWMLPVMFVIGFMIPLVDGPLMAVLQAKIDHAYQGRVMTLFGTIGGLSGQIGLSMAGRITDALGLRIWFFAGGGLIILTLLFGISNKHLMRIDDGPDQAE